MISIKSKIDLLRKKFAPQTDYIPKDIKKEFAQIIQPRRYKIPIFGNLGENNCLFADCLFVSKYNKEEKFNKKTQWKKKEPVKVYVKLVAKNDNSKILFDILEKLKFDKNIKANNILVEHCVAQLKDEIEDVKTKSRVLYKALQRTDRNRQKKYISIMLCFVAVAFVFLILSGIYELK